MTPVKEIQRQLVGYKNAYGAAQESLKLTKEGLMKAEEALVNLETAQEIVQTVAQSIQQQIHTRIADVVSRCLSAVFDEPYEFRIIFEQKRGKTEARLIFVRDEQEIDPMTAAGGGVIDVAA